MKGIALSLLRVVTFVLFNTVAHGLPKSTLLYLELLGFWTLFIVRHSKKSKAIPVTGCGGL
jgi:hypothetical protein